MNRASGAALIVLALVSVGLSVWVLATRSREHRDSQQPPRADEPEAPMPADIGSQRLVVELPEGRDRVDDLDDVPDAPQPAQPQQINPGVSLEFLSIRLKEFDSNRSWDSAHALLQSCIQVEWDANGRYEDVTGKWDEIDPSNGHKMLKLPKYDPAQEGFLSILDPRGSRWYRFTRQDFPEWWDLNFPAEGSATGTQEGFAMPRRVADDLATSIRSRANGLLDRYKDK